MIPYPRAVRLILEEARPLATEEVSPVKAVGRFAASLHRSPSTLPPFPNSAMDGFALRSRAEGIPAGTRLRVAGRVAAGDAPAEGAAEGEDLTWEIMTGAPVPEGLDAVVPVERVEVEEEEGGRAAVIRLLETVSPEANVRPAGQDFQTGDPVLEPGRRIGSVELMALAAVGIRSVHVYQQPRAAVLSTGPELVEGPEAPLLPGQIRNSNGPFLARALEEAGVRVIRKSTVGDAADPFVAEVEGALAQGALILVSTGAVSMGRYDFVPSALERLGARVLFHRAAIRPGKPILVASLPGGALHFALPGNPISAAVGFRFFLLPYLRAIRGQAPERPWSLPLLHPHRKPGGLRQFAKARVELREGGAAGIRILPGQQSFRIAPLLEANAWGVLPEGEEEVPEGARVEAWGLVGSLRPDDR
jgi:molybdopterin molybdotransferase